MQYPDLSEAPSTTGKLYPDAIPEVVVVDGTELDVDQGPAQSSVASNVLFLEVSKSRMDEVIQHAEQRKPQPVTTSVMQMLLNTTAKVKVPKNLHRLKHSFMRRIHGYDDYADDAEEEAAAQEVETANSATNFGNETAKVFRVPFKDAIHLHMVSEVTSQRLTTELLKANGVKAADFEQGKFAFREFNGLLSYKTLCEIGLCAKNFGVTWTLQELCSAYNKPLATVLEDLEITSVSDMLQGGLKTTDLAELGLDCVELLHRGMNFESLMQLGLFFKPFAKTFGMQWAFVEGLKLTNAQKCVLRDQRGWTQAELHGAGMGLSQKFIAENWC